MIGFPLVKPRLPYQHTEKYGSQNLYQVFYANAKKMKERGEWMSDLCPLCNNHIETTSHLICCNDERAREQYASSIEKFFLHLTRTHTHPSIIEIFERVLRNPWPTSFEFSLSPYENNELVKQAAKEQDEIGWINFFKGHISKQWAKIQLQHYGTMYKNPPSLTHWSKNIIINIYDVSYSMWMNRNRIVHEVYEDQLNKKESMELQRQIIHEYESGSHTVLRQHRYMFEESIDDLFKKTVTEKKYWLESIKASRICFEKGTPVHNNSRTINLQHATVPD